MDKRYRFKKWKKYQSSRKDRKGTPWIKLHKSILEKNEFMEDLTEGEQSRLMKLMLISDPKTGELPPPNRIRFRLFIDDIDMTIYSYFIEEIKERKTNDVNQDGNHSGNQDGNQMSTTLAPKRRGEESISKILSGANEEYLAHFKFCTKNANETWAPGTLFIQTISGAFPDVNFDEEFRKIEAWLLSNPSKRKTGRGMKRFLNSWLSRANDEKKKNKPKEIPQTEEGLFDSDGNPI